MSSTRNNFNFEDLQEQLNMIAQIGSDNNSSDSIAIYNYFLEELRGADDSSSSSIYDETEENNLNDFGDLCEEEFMSE